MSTYAIPKAVLAVVGHTVLKGNKAPIKKKLHIETLEKIIKLIQEGNIR